MQTKTRIVVAISLFLYAIFSSLIYAAEAELDCQKTTEWVEYTICKSDPLLQEEKKLAELYQNVMARVTDDIKTQIDSDQRVWLKKRDEHCRRDVSEVENCLLTEYQERNAALSAFLAFDSSDHPSDEPLKILRITPHGHDVLAGKQIVFQFNRPVVPIGRMERDANDIPVDISPILNCEWRWLNTSALACQLREEAKMQQATRYNITMRPGIMTESGAGLKKLVRHTFTTTRPKVTYSRFMNWLSPGTPLIQVTFNQPATKLSVERSLTMETTQNKKVSIVAHPDDMPITLPYWMALTNEETQPGVNDNVRQVNDETARRVWIVEPVTELPLDESIQLKVNPGLASSEGSEKGIETRTIVRFDTYPHFEFLGIRCTPKGERRAVDIPLSNLDGSNKNNVNFKNCAPLKHLALVFSAPIFHSAIKQHVEFNPALNAGRKDYDPWENIRDWTQLTQPHRKGRNYQIWLPEQLKAYQKYSISFDTQKLTDEFDRKLAEKIKFNFHTAHREPNLVINHHVAVLEKNIDSDVPMYVTNLKDVTISYDRMGDTTSESGRKKNVSAPNVEDVSVSIPMGVRELVGDDTGIVYGSAHPEPVPPDWYRDPEIFAQITPYQVHAKIGHFNSIIWVTDFANGEPVNNASISLHKGSYQGLNGLEDLGVTATTNKAGLAELPGLSELDPNLAFINNGYRKQHPGLFVKVEKEGDIALVPLNNQFMVSGRGVWPYLQRKNGHTHAWGMTAQGVYKLGDNVEFKIYVRDQSNKHWVTPGQKNYKLAVYDPQDKIVYEQKNITLNAFGAFDASFKVSEQGTVGWYHFKLSPINPEKENTSHFTWSPMSVLVSDFTPSPFKVNTELNGDLFKTNDPVQITSLATLHSGGPFGDADVRLTARLKIKPFKTDNPKAAGFIFGGSSGKRLNQEQSQLLDVRAKLNDAGQYEAMFTLPQTDIYYGTLMVESAVKNERGKYVASSATADYAGRSRFVGMRNTRWLYEKGKKSNLEIVVVNQQGDLVPGADVTLTINHRKYKASRVKGPGNAYLTKNIMTWEKESSCHITTIDAATPCSFSPKNPGYYQFIAHTNDNEGRTHTTTLYGWVIGQGVVVWDQTNDANLQIIAEQTDYNVGETARYLIKNPFPGAKALITVERYGILDSWTQILETSTPVIEVPIKPDYLPGFYLSVVVVSPRVDKPMGAGKVDLGKPSYRMGYISAKVADPFKQLDIKVKTEKDVYKPRDTVKVDIHVESKTDTETEPFEIAVVVIDESVLALNKKGKRYYDPYAGFNKLDELDVANYSLISRLVGRQKFEKKGVNPGGGGGSSAAQLRDRFKFISYWNPSITPDSQGKAAIEFEVPDNLTGWRILAFAVTPNDKMGLGESNIKVNRPTELRPVMPNQIIEGDNFKAGFNLMNRTDKSRDLTVSIQVRGPLTKDSKSTFSQTVNVPAFKRKNIWLPVSSKGHGELTFTAQAGDKSDMDAIKHSVTVNKRRSLETASTYGTTTSALATESVTVPKGIYTDVGEIGVVLSPSVISNIDGAFKYVKDYPYFCWEQRLSKAVMATSYLELNEYLQDNIKWEDASDEVTQALNYAANFQAPNGGMVYWIPKNKNVSPYLSAYTAMAFNWLRRDGYTVPESVERNLHDYLLHFLRRNEFPDFYTKGMSSSVRAVALSALAESGKIDKSDIERYQRHIPEMDLFGKSHFLQAAIKVDGIEQDIITTTIDSILGHASQTGGKFQFNEPWDDSYKYILATPLRSNCSILSSLLLAQTKLKTSNNIADIPFKLTRAITQSRGNRDHWENTQENVFCLNALVDYANIYEPENPDMRVSVTFDQEAIGETSFKKKTAPSVTLSRKITGDDPGKSANIKIMKEGSGRLYYSARISYDLQEDNVARINSGIEIRREYSVEREGKFTILETPMNIKRGEIVRVDLFLSVPTARHFVVVNDSVPGGLEPVNADLATSSIVDVNKGEFKAAEGSWWYTFSDWSYYGRYFWSFYHKELKHDSARFYADYLPAGNYQLSYTAQAIAEGQFTIMPVHAEEMYDPDVYGKGLPATLNVSN